MTVHPEDEVTVTVLREDAVCLVLGPLDYAVKTGAGEVEGGGSVMRLRQTLARALKDSS